jgi:hypothetical protein
VSGNPNNLRDGLLLFSSVGGIAMYLLAGRDRAFFYIRIVLLVLIGAQRLQLWRKHRRLAQR